MGNKTSVVFPKRKKVNVNLVKYELQISELYIYVNIFLFVNCVKG